MTLGEALAEINETKPNQIDRKILISYLSRLDLMAIREIIETHEGYEEYIEPPEKKEEVAPVQPESMQEENGAREENKYWKPYNDDTSEQTELLIPAPYDEVYIHYLAAQIDRINQEMEKYNNDITLFNSTYLEFAAYYNRNHMHLQTPYRAY